MLPSARQRALRVLHDDGRPDVSLCRRVESACHAASENASEYERRVLRAAYNLRVNPRVGEEVAFASDEFLARGTVVEDVRNEHRCRVARFEDLLQEKYEALDDETFHAIVRCKKCGSKQVKWEEKQTRGADEAATVFVQCEACGNRWVIR